MMKSYAVYTECTRSGVRAYCREDGGVRSLFSMSEAIDLVKDIELSLSPGWSVGYEIIP